MWSRIAAVLVFVLLALATAGFSASREDSWIPEFDSPEVFVDFLVQSYQNQDDDALLQCYGVEEIGQCGIEFEKEFFRSVGATEIYNKGTEILLEANGFTYVGIWLDFVTEDTGTIPFYEYYLLYGNEEEGYLAVSKEKYPDWMLSEIETFAGSWENTALYQSYVQAEAAYVGEYPGYANDIYDRLMISVQGTPTSMRKNMTMLGVIFLMAVTELVLLLLWGWCLENGRKKRTIKKSKKRRI